MYDTLHIIGLPWTAGQDLTSMQGVQLWRPVWSCGVTNHMLYCIIINAITNNHSSHNNYSFKGTLPSAVLTIAAFQEHMNHPGSLDPIMLLYLSMCIQVQSSCRGGKNFHLGFSTSAPLVPVQSVWWVSYITCISGRRPTDTCACSGGGNVPDWGIGIGCTHSSTTDMVQT